MPRPLKVLLVEDEDTDAMLTERAFVKSSQVAITRAKNGADAVVMLGSKKKFHIVLLDLNLGGGIDGFEVLARVKEMGLSIPIVILSSSNAQGEIDLSWSLGAVGYIQKPVGTKQLLETASKFCGWWNVNELPSK